MPNNKAETTCKSIKKQVFMESKKIPPSWIKNLALAYKKPTLVANHVQIPQNHILQKGKAWIL
jgi:hypothetical protein